MQQKEKIHHYSGALPLEDEVLMKSLRTALAPLLVSISLGLTARDLAAQQSDPDSAALVAVTQRLLDAITNGDSAVWSAYLAPDWFATDEEGNHLTRADFLAAIHPLPGGQSGKLSVGHPYWLHSGTTAVLAYEANEEHHYYGQTILTRFMTTDTWLKRKGRWWQIATQQTALPTPINGVTLPAEKVKPYVGTYELTPGIRMDVVSTANGLETRREGQPGRPFYAIDDRIFIRHGARGFWVFETDSTGKVDRVVDWRDNNAVTWMRVE